MKPDFELSLAMVLLSLLSSYESCVWFGIPLASDRWDARLDTVLNFFEGLFDPGVSSICNWLRPVFSAVN
jgi:hypothetical protein